MKFYKRLSMDANNLQRQTFAVEESGQIITDTKVSLQIPAGDRSLRPNMFVDGQIRYSTTLNEFEVYNGSGSGTGWEIMRTIRPANIIVQTVGSGDYVTTKFGPLQYAPGLNYRNFQKPQNIMVYIENVYQIPFTNYTLVQSGSSDVFIEFTSPPPTKPITAILGFDGYYPPFNS